MLDMYLHKSAVEAPAKWTWLKWSYVFLYNNIFYPPLVPHIYASGSYNGLWSIGPLGTNCSEILIKIQNVSFMKMHLKMSSAKWRPFCPGGDELTNEALVTPSLWEIICDLPAFVSNIVEDV